MRNAGSSRPSSRRHQHDIQVTPPDIAEPCAVTIREAAKALARLLGRQLAQEVLHRSTSGPEADNAAISIANTGQSALPQEAVPSPSQPTSDPLDNDHTSEGKIRPQQS